MPSRPLRPIDPHELAALTGDSGAVGREARHLNANAFLPSDPSWSRIAVAAAVVLVLVPLFLAWCGSF